MKNNVVTGVLVALLVLTGYSAYATGKINDKQAQIILDYKYSQVKQEDWRACKRNEPIERNDLFESAERWIDNLDENMKEDIRRFRALNCVNFIYGGSDYDGITYDLGSFDQKAPSILVMVNPVVPKDEHDLVITHELVHVWQILTGSQKSWQEKELEAYTIQGKLASKKGITKQTPERYAENLFNQHISQYTKDNPTP